MFWKWWDTLVLLVYFVYIAFLDIITVESSASGCGEIGWPNGKYYEGFVTYLDLLALIKEKETWLRGAFRILASSNGWLGYGVFLQVKV